MMFEKTRKCLKLILKISEERTTAGINYHIAGNTAVLLPQAWRILDFGHLKRIKTFPCVCTTDLSLYSLLLHRSTLSLESFFFNLSEEEKLLS